MDEQTYADYRLNRGKVQSPADPVAVPSTLADGQESPPVEPVTSEEDEETPQEKIRNTRLENRFKRLTERLRTKDREIAELSGQLSAVMQMVTPAVPAQPAGRPVRGHYADDETYFEALIDWKDSQKGAQQAVSQPTAPPVGNPVLDAYQKRLVDVKKQHADYDEVVEAADVRIQPGVSAAILESDVGPALVYYLAQHPEEAEALNTLGPVALGKALARLEMPLLAPKPPETIQQQRTAQPVPITPVTGGETAGVSGQPDKLSYKDYREWREKGRRR